MNITPKENKTKTLARKFKELFIKPRKVHNISSRQARLKQAIESEVIELPTGEMEKRLYG